MCSINEGAEELEIFAPASNDSLFKRWGCLFYVFLFTTFVGIGDPVAGGIFVGIALAVFHGISYLIEEHSQNTEIILRSNQHSISLWKQSRSSGQQQCLRKIACSRIHKLQLVNNKQYYHVAVYTSCASNYKDGILIGDREFWLSRREAEWLAHELSIWLKIPITEKEVEIIENDYGG